MTEKKFTPGPWSPHGTGLARSGKPEFEIHWSKYGECVAEIVHGEADARLIAAAPELYEALEWAMRFVEQVRAESPAPKGGGEDIAYRKAQAALAKARGEA